MARWDAILSLPVQSPPTLEFSAADIFWSKVEGWRDAIDRVALIPFSRVDDFVRGESANKECPTRFHVEARRRRPPEMPYKQKVDGIIEYILYWCSFGPDDHRKGGIIRPSRVYNAKRKTPAGRPNTKRGCVCHFIVKRLIAEPTVALIIYNQDKHVDKKGQPCHGPLDKKAVGTRAMYAPYISDELRLRVLSLLYVGVPVETIMQRHTESVEKNGGPANRDDLLTHRYVRRLERNIRRFSYELDPDDAVSAGMWVDSHRNHIFYYEDFTDSDPVVVGIQTDWQLQQMIRFGNRSLIASDSSSGTNKLKYSVQSLVVFNENNKAIPVAWIITSSASGEVHKWMRALYDRVHSKDPTWKLAGFIVDLPSADIFTIREVFQCSVLVSFWRVRHSWHKNVVEKCQDTEMHVELLRRLGQAIDCICRGNGGFSLFENFIEDFVDCAEFLDYFIAVWIPRLGMWTRALKMLPIASQETCAAMEFYHHQLKLRLLNEKDHNVYQRLDWLVHKLSTKVHSYYWLDEYPRKDEFARYQKDEWMSGLTFWQRGSQIPDSDVFLEQRCAKVVSQQDLQKTHIVWNPGSDFALCDCDWSRVGYLCKHVIKVSQVCRRKGLAPSSISLLKYNQMLVNMLHCPPHDSLIRDHAVSLAVSVQMQLNMVLNADNCNDSRTGMAPVEQSSTHRDATSSNIDDSVRNENQSMADNSSSFGVTDESQADHAKEAFTGTQMDIDLVTGSTPLNESRPIVEDQILSEKLEENGQKTKMGTNFYANVHTSLDIEVHEETDNTATCDTVAKLDACGGGVNMKKMMACSTSTDNLLGSGKEDDVLDNLDGNSFVFPNMEVQNDTIVATPVENIIDFLQSENGIAGIPVDVSFSIPLGASNLYEKGVSDIMDDPDADMLVCSNQDNPVDAGGRVLGHTDRHVDMIDDGSVASLPENHVLINGHSDNKGKKLHVDIFISQDIQTVDDFELGGFIDRKMECAAGENGACSIGVLSSKTIEGSSEEKCGTSELK